MSARTRRPGQVLAGLLAAVGAVLSCVAASEECRAPARPQLPDGARSTHEEMLAGQAAVQAFQEANMEYMHCLEAHFTRARQAADRAADQASRALASGAYRDATSAYNAAVSAEEEVAGAFNIELREYRARRKK